MRSVFGSIPRECAVALIIPEELSDIALLQRLEELLSKGITSSDSVSYRSLEDLADLGKLFGMDLSRIVYGKNLSTESTTTYQGFHSGVGSSRNDIDSEIFKDELKTVREGECNDHNIEVKQDNHNYNLSSAFEKAWNEGMLGQYPVQESNKFQREKLQIKSEKSDNDYSVGTDVNSNSTRFQLSVKKSELTVQALHTSRDAPP